LNVFVAKFEFLKKKIEKIPKKTENKFKKYNIIPTLIPSLPGLLTAVEPPGTVHFKYYLFFQI